MNKELAEKMQAAFVANHGKPVTKDSLLSVVIEQCAAVASEHYGDKCTRVEDGLPFNAKYLHNPHWKPKTVDSDYDREQLELWSNAQKEVLYNNVIVHYESCDCGGDYGCSHPNYPYRITFTNSKHEIVDEGDQWCFCGDNGAYLSLSITEDLKLSKFIKACEFVGIELLPQPPQQ